MRWLWLVKESGLTLWASHRPGVAFVGAMITGRHACRDVVGRHDLPKCQKEIRFGLPGASRRRDGAPPLLPARKRLNPSRYIGFIPIFTTMFELERWCVYINESDSQLRQVK